MIGFCKVCGRDTNVEDVDLNAANWTGSQIHDSAARKGEIVRRSLLGLLDKPVEDQNAALPHAEQDASDPVARQRRADLPVVTNRMASTVPFCRECLAMLHHLRARPRSSIDE